MQEEVGGTLTTQKMQSNLIDRDGKKDIYNKALNNLKEKEKNYGKSTSREGVSGVHEGASRSEVREQDRKLRLYIEEAIKAIDKSREDKYKEKGYLSQAKIARLLREGRETPESLSSSSLLDAYDTYEEYSEAYDTARKEQDKVFNEWWKQNQKKYKLKNPVLRKLEVDWSKDPKDMSRAERNNALIDMMRGAMTAPYASKLLLQPQGFQAHKEASRLCGILTQRSTKQLMDILEKAGIKDIDKEHPAKTLAKSPMPFLPFMSLSHSTLSTPPSHPHFLLGLSPIVCTALRTLAADTRHVDELRSISVKDLFCYLLICAATLIGFFYVCLQPDLQRQTARNASWLR